MIFIEKIWIIILFGMPGIAMYLFARNIFKDFKYSRMAGFFAGLLYTFNLYVVQIGAYQTNTKLMMIALPLVLLFFKLGLEQYDLKNRVKYAIYANFVLLISISANVNLAVTSVIPIMLLAYLIFFIAINPKKIRQSVLYALIFAGIWVLLNVWWFLPFVINSLQFNQVSGVFTFQKIDTGQFHNFFRFLGSWGWYDNHNGSFYFSYWTNFDQPLFLILSYGITAIALLALLLNYKNKHVRFFAIMALVGLFLAKGSTPPFGEMYNYLYTHIKILWIYREPWAKFTPIHLFSISILFGCSIAYLFDYFRRKAPLLAFLIPPLGLCLVLVVAFPLLTGKIIWNTNTGLMRSNYVSIPGYWNDANSWFSSNTSQDERVMLIPPTGYAVGHKWEHGFFAGDNPALVLINNRTIKYTSFPTTKADQLIDEMYMDTIDHPEKLIEYANKFNIKYVLYDKSVDYNYSTYNRTAEPVQKNAQMISDSIRNSGKLELVQTFGDLLIYKIKGTDPNSQIISVEKDGSLVPISFEEINPVEFKINTKGLVAPFTLILNQNFNGNWKAKTSDREEIDHHLYNGFANSWAISKNVDTVTIEYKLQRTQYVSIAISALALLGTIFYLNKVRKLNP